MTKIGVLIPTRGNRPEFLKNCLRMIGAQTLRPTIISVVDDAPLNDECDITYRYRIGYDRLRNKGLDVIAFIEDDDYYHPEYLREMSAMWEQFNRPELFGYGYTIFYHLKLKKYFKITHDQRAMAMNTLIKPDMNFNWSVDSDPYTDQWLWMPNTNNGITHRRVWSPDSVRCIGIKHGFTVTGGKNHVDHLHRFNKDDKSMNWLLWNTDPASFRFYQDISTANMVFDKLKGDVDTDKIY